MRIVIAEPDGFVGKNLRVQLRERGYTDIAGIPGNAVAGQWAKALASADFIFNLGNGEGLAGALAAAGRRIGVVDVSSDASVRNALRRYGRDTGSPIYLLKRADVFGKWQKPGGESAVATFCHGIAHVQPVAVADPSAPLHLLYIDDLIEALIGLLAGTGATGGEIAVAPVYTTTAGEVADIVRGFAESRSSLLTPRAGSGLTRALYATYMSYLPPGSFSYQVPRYDDSRGAFAEVLKTPDCGQLSYFTAHPGVTRGEHYHHSKSEKFIVVRGTAKFRFRHIETGDMHDITVRGGEGHVVETVPGWAHDITNIGTDDLVVMLWANEIFDRSRPDTITMEIVA